MGIHDTQCGAKVMTREAVEKVHSTLLIADMAFDINLLYSLHRAGYRILEVPTEWTDKIGTKVTLFRTSFVMFLSGATHLAGLSPAALRIAASAPAIRGMGLQKAARSAAALCFARYKKPSGRKKPE